MKKTAFVTGAAGFLGRHLVRALVEDQWSVHALVRSAVPTWLQQERVVVHRGGLDDPAVIEAAMPLRVDAVFHLAGKTSMWSGDMPALVRDNVDATRHLLQAAQCRQAQRMVMTSTLGIFQNALGRITESTPFRPLSERNPYLRTKLLADELLTQAANQGMSVVSMHPAHILGPHDQTGWVSLFRDGAQGKLKTAPGGSASFCAAERVAQAHIAAVAHAHPARRYVLAGADATYLEVFAEIAHRVNAKPVTSTAPSAILKTVATLSQLFSHITARAPSLTPGLAAVLASDMLANCRLAERDLGYQPVTLDTMLDATHADWLARQRQTL